MNDNAWLQLVRALQCLPHVGVKSSQRMAFHLLTRARPQAEILSTALAQALESLKYCELCRNLCADTRCGICNHKGRRRDILCVVQSPMDLMAIEQTHSFDGLYFVLTGAVSPLEDIGVEDIGLEALQRRINHEVDHPIHEVVLATNFNAEGETTAHLIADMLQKANIKITRLAHGVPVGGELEYLDSGTIAKALAARQSY